MKSSVLLAAFICAAIVSIAPHVAKARAPCTLKMLTALPLGDEHLFLHIPVVIDGHHRDMILDTGSEGSLITPGAATSLSLGIDPQRTTLIHGPNGRSDLVSNRLIPSLRLGSVDLGGWSMPLGILPNLPKSLETLSGLLGANVLQDFAVEFDAPHHVLRLWRFVAAPAKCKSSPPTTRMVSPSMPGWIKLTSHRRGLRLNVGFTLDGAEGNALIDSGARSITLSRRFANMMGVSNALLERDKGGVTSGVDLNARRYYWHSFNNLHFRSHAKLDQMALVSIDHPVITVTDIDDDADMLLGADWLARHDVFVSFQTSEIWVR